MMRMLGLDHELLSWTTLPGSDLLLSGTTTIGNHIRAPFVADDEKILQLRFVSHRGSDPGAQHWGPLPKRSEYTTRTRGDTYRNHNVPNLTQHGARQPSEARHDQASVLMSTTVNSLTMYL